MFKSITEYNKAICDYLNTVILGQPYDRLYAKYDEKTLHNLIAYCIDTELVRGIVYLTMLGGTKSLQSTGNEYVTKDGYEFLAEYKQYGKSISVLKSTWLSYAAIGISAVSLLYTMLGN